MNDGLIYIELLHQIGLEGLEPPHLAVPDLKSGASASSATGPKLKPAPSGFDPTPSLFQTTDPCIGPPMPTPDMLYIRTRPLGPVNPIFLIDDAGHEIPLGDKDMLFPTKTDRCAPALP